MIWHSIQLSLLVVSASLGGARQAAPPSTGSEVQTRVSSDLESGDPIVVHVVVALCDNKNQGIVPVPKSLGNGQCGVAAARRLFWGVSLIWPCSRTSQFLLSPTVWPARPWRSLRGMLLLIDTKDADRSLPALRLRPGPHQFTPQVNSTQGGSPRIDYETSSDQTNDLIR